MHATRSSAGPARRRLAARKANGHGALRLRWRRIDSRGSANAGHLSLPYHRGRDDPSNMRWQTTAEAEEKDGWE